jgi:two-component sensor histidine kinase
MKNMMAVIQSLARQSMRDSGSKDEFFEQFSGRLTSYSKSVDMLVANRWQGLQIHELIRCQLAAFGVRDGGQVQIDGPELRLSTIGAHNLSLAVHELATNAVKYGALSVPSGRVILAWSIFPYRGEDCFGLHWQEVSGPSVIPPTNRGFGRRIVEDLVPSALGGHATHAFGADGVSWKLIAPTSSALA